MNKKLLIVGMAFTAIATLSGCSSANESTETQAATQTAAAATTAETKSDFIKREDAKKAAVKKQAEEAQKNNISEPEDDDTSSSKDVFPGLEKIKKDNKRDLKAYKILAKYYGEKYNRTKLFDLLNEDAAYMDLMMDLLKESKLTKDETKIIKAYLQRRYELMGTPNFCDKEYEDSDGNLITESNDTGIVDGINVEQYRKKMAAALKIKYSRREPY